MLRLSILKPNTRKCSVPVFEVEILWETPVPCTGIPIKIPNPKHRRPINANETEVGGSVQLPVTLRSRCFPVSDRFWVSTGLRYRFSGGSGFYISAGFEGFLPLLLHTSLHISGQIRNKGHRQSTAISNNSMELLSAMHGILHPLSLTLMILSLLMALIKSKVTAVRSLLERYVRSTEIVRLSSPKVLHNCVNSPLKETRWIKIR